MKCPKCKKEINEVCVYSQCFQYATLKDKQIVEYGAVEEILNTERIECPLCQADLTNLVVES
jgi:hypothetical protein